MHGYFELVTPQNDFILWKAKYIYCIFFLTLDPFHFHCMDKKCLFFFCSTEEISSTKKSMLAVCTHQCWPGPQLALLLPRTLVRCECLQDTAGWCWFYSWGLCLSVRCWLGGVIRWQTLHEEVQRSLIIACLTKKPLEKSVKSAVVCID